MGHMFVNREATEFLKGSYEIRMKMTEPIDSERKTAERLS
jgi:hypothetical protein